MSPCSVRSSLAFLMFLGLVPTASAGCVKYPSQGSPQMLSFGTVEVPQATPVGAVLAEKTTLAWSSPEFKCVKPVRTATLGLFPNPSALGAAIYATNIPGVGIRTWFFNNNYGELQVPDRQAINWTFKAQLANAHFRVQLIKTGDVAIGGALLTGTLARGGYDDKAQAWVDLRDTQIEPQRPTCAFASRNLTFALGNVDVRGLRDAGSSAWATQQLVATACVNTSQILMTFSAPADTKDASLFRLTGPDAASGVAVELRSDDPDMQAIPNSTTPLLLPARNEGRTYGFRARYRTTAANPTPGPANASITVNVGYR